LGKLGTQLNLNTDTVGGIRVGWPRDSEGAGIADLLDKTTADIGTGIARARREIELVREYRTRLIADVVTGKVDVREVAATLPDEPPEDELEPLQEEETVESGVADDELLAAENTGDE
jgi:type I restriction enzyme S subunit